MISGIDRPSIPDPAEATDGVDLLPGTVGFPETDPTGVGPAGSPTDADHHDSFAERVDREMPAEAPLPHDSARFIDPTAGGSPDTESDLIGEMVATTGLVSPEEAAMHLETDDESDSESNEDDD